jgi:excisionase family DNA binding protein
VQPVPGRQALTAPEAAWELHCHPNTVWNLIRSGQLESFTLGRKRLIARSALESLITRGGTTQEAR